MVNFEYVIISWVSSEQIFKKHSMIVVWQGAYWQTLTISARSFIVAMQKFYKFQMNMNKIYTFS